MPILDELSRALECPQNGRLDQAARLYQGTLARDPTHVGALHLLGRVAF
jgi:hypothetical protein